MVGKHFRLQALLITLGLLLVTLVNAQVSSRTGVASTLMPTIVVQSTQPSAPASGTAWWFNSNTTTGNAIMGYDGTGWQSDAALSTKMINVLDPRWGAKGDGVTDDTAAVQAAINAGNNAGGIRTLIIFPQSSSSYNIAGTLTNTNNVTLVLLGTQSFSGAGAPTANVMKLTGSPTFPGTLTTVGLKTTGAYGANVISNDVNIGHGFSDLATNTAMGLSALAVNTTGNHNTAMGWQALNANTTGIANTGFGYAALQLNTTGSSNTAVSESTLAANVSGNNNTAMGDGALQRSLSSFNSAFGANALTNVNAAGNGNNTAIGYNAGTAYTTGINNTIVGSGSALLDTTGSFNTVVGQSAGANLNNLASSGNNTIIGYNTGNGITTGTSNTIIGAGVTGLAASLSNNVIIADGAGNKRIWDNNGSMQFVATGGYSFGGGPITGAGVLLRTVVSVLGGSGSNLEVSGTLTATANNDSLASISTSFQLNTTIAKAGFTGLDAAMVNLIGAGLVQSGTGTIARASSLKISSAPTIGTNNYAIYVGGGNINTTTADGYLINDVALKNVTETLSNKTISAPVLSGTATGTYTLGGTPTIGSGVLLGASIALGGGAAPTLGTIGGSGPTIAGQNSWMQVKDSAGATVWIPVWK